MKPVFLLAALALLTGCGPQMLINRATGETVTCKLEGYTPGLNRRLCIEDHEAQGWVKTTEKEANDVNNKLSKIKKQQLLADACMVNVVKIPELQVISNKISLYSSSNQTFSHLTNSNKPTEEEKSAISLYASEIKKCAAEDEKAYANNPPTVTAVNHSAISALESLLASLYEGHITYGDFAKMRKQVANNRESAIAQIVMELQKNAADADARAQQIAAQNAIAQSQASQAISSSMMAGAAMANAFKPTQVIAPASPALAPRTNINCTTSAVGNSLNTNCY